MSIEFRGVSWRSTGNAAPELRIARCQSYIAQFRRDARRAVFTSSMVYFLIPLRNTRDAVSKLRISRVQFQREVREMPSPECGFQVFNDISRHILEIREMPSANCGLHVVNGIRRNSAEEYEECRLQTADFASSMVFRAIQLTYEKRRVRTANFEWPMVFHAISLRSTRDAASKLWISSCQEYFTQFQ